MIWKVNKEQTHRHTYLCGLGQVDWPCGPSVVVRNDDQCVDLGQRSTFFGPGKVSKLNLVHSQAWRRQKKENHLECSLPWIRNSGIERDTTCVVPLRARHRGSDDMLLGILLILPENGDRVKVHRFQGLALQTPPCWR